MTDHKDHGLLRVLVGLLALGGAMAGFFLLFYIEIPPRNENALLLALGVVLGWAGAVVGSEYGATTTGRKVAESAIRNIERHNTDPVPQNVEEAAQEVADAGQQKADTIKGEGV